MPYPWYDFVVMTPVYQGVDGITCWCVEKAHQAGLDFLWVPGADGKGDALITRSRSIMATHFMEHGMSNYMIFLDSDIVFVPEQLKMLYDDLREGYDVVGGMYPVRAGTDNSSRFYSDDPPKEGDPLGVRKIQFLSTGFMGISKYALTKLVKEYHYPGGSPLPLLHPETEWARSYPFFESTGGFVQTNTPNENGWIWLSDDWDFCEKVRSVGLEVYADMRIQLGHCAVNTVTFADVRRHKMEKLQAQQEESPPDDRDFIAESTEGAE